MKKKLQKLMSYIFIFCIIILNVSYVIAFENEKTIFEISKSEVSKGDLILLNINLDMIDKTKYNISLQSSESLENTIIEENNIETNISNNEINFSIDKEESNISSLTLKYQIPENIEVGKIINFNLIISEEDEEDIIINENIKVVEKQVEENQILSENNNTQTINSTKSKSQSINQVENKPSIKYHGSPNNYLKSLTVSNYELDKDFLKERLTYFLEVENDVESIKINVKKDDSNSIVNISGNTNLKVGLNKVIINVEAKNGNVKTYRIYVTRASEE